MDLEPQVRAEGLLRPVHQAGVGGVARMRPAHIVGVDLKLVPDGSLGLQRTNPRRHAKVKQMCAFECEWKGNSHDCRSGDSAKECVLWRDELECTCVRFQILHGAGGTDAAEWPLEVVSVQPLGSESSYQTLFEREGARGQRCREGNPGHPPRMALSRLWSLILSTPS